MRNKKGARPCIVPRLGTVTRSDAIIRWGPALDPYICPPTGKGRRNAASPCAASPSANGVPRRQPVGIAGNRGFAADPPDRHVAKISGSAQTVTHFCAAAERDGRAKPRNPLCPAPGTAIAEHVPSRSRDIPSSNGGRPGRGGGDPPPRRMAADRSPAGGPQNTGQHRWFFTYDPIHRPDARCLRHGGVTVWPILNPIS